MSNGTDDTEPQNINDDIHLRCGMVAVIGRANVGKSTLINTILEEKVSIVSGVAQTTRNLIRGIFTDPRGQLVFLDTPGVHKAKGELGKIMNKQARASVEGSDVVLLVLDSSTAPAIEDDGWMRRLAHEGATLVFLLNKTDKGTDHSEEYKELWQTLCAEKGVEKDVTWMPTSALKQEGIDDLVVFLFDHMPLSPLLFPEDVLTDFPRKLNIGDIVREQLFGILYQELPHSIAIIVEEIHESPEKWIVEANIYVERHSQKVIVLGKKGRGIRTVKRRSEKILSDMYSIPVEVKLWIKVEPKWAKNFWLLKKMGYLE